IIPESFTFMTCVDVDDKELVDKAIQRALEVNEDEYSDWQGQVLRIEYSARKKVHIYIRIPKGMTIEEAQQAFCQEIGVPYDESCITPERFIYQTGIDEEVYRSPHWLEALSDEEVAERREAYLNRGLDVDGRAPRPHPLRGTGGMEGLRDVGDKNPNDNVNPNPKLSTLNSQPSTPSDRTLYIFDACMREAGLQENDLVEEGGRHNALKSILSVGATQLLTKEELIGVLQVRMAANWQDANIQTLVNDFYQKYTDSSQKMTQFQRKVFAMSRKLNLNDNLNPDLDESSPDGLPITGEMSAGQRGSMPRRLPKLIELLTSKTPKEYKEAVAHAVFPALATHLCNVRFEYTDYVEHEATLMNCLMAGTGSGKGCIDKPIEHIMADIKRRDKENENREKEWKKENLKRGDNKDKLVRPEGLVIQMIDPDMTKPALVTRLDEAEGHFVYVKLNELDLFNQLRGQTGNQHFQLMCLAFDPDSEYGQTRIGTQSVTARPQCRFNWNACTTVLKGRRFFKNVLTDGPISRINFCTIPEQEIGADQPIYGKYDVAFDEALKPYIDNLVAARGLIECPQAWRLAKKLQAECAEFARLSQNEVYWNLSHRACVIAWLKACVLYVANGQKWEKTIEDFIRWSLNYDLWCKMEFFGEDIAKANRGDERVGKRGPRNLLELLPDTFTLEDAMRVRRQEGLDTQNTIKMVRNWKSRNYVTQISDISFQKSQSKGKGKSDK
ncbi:MAG: hypothetical protein J5616_03735, partial [Bacteroidaceae bacterium]|nr:hypothetical protein [Bacteroidaceae bacterium]